MTVSWKASPALIAVLLLLSGRTTGRCAAKDEAVVDYAIIVTGGELLAGAYPDAHTHFLTRTLHPMGLHCVGSRIVDDREDDIKAALRQALATAPLVIVTGGLGPTDNDITRQALSAFTGIPLEENSEVLAAMERRFNMPRDQLRANLRRQSQVPTRGAYLKSANGTAVGLVFELGEKVIVALPGPPRELQPMVGDELAPYLTRRFGAHAPGCALNVRFAGIGQSAIDEALKAHTTMPPGVILNSQFEAGRVDFTFGLPHDTPGERASLDALKRQIEGCLGEYIYTFGDAPLEEVVLARLAAGGSTLAVAEVGSGGALAAGLNGAAGAEVVVAGAFSAPSAERLRQLLRVPDAAWRGCGSDEERLRLLAEAVARETPGQWAIAVGAPESNAAGVPSAAVVFRLPGGRMEVRRFGLRGSGAEARAGLATQVLDDLRRQLR